MADRWDNIEILQAVDRHQQLSDGAPDWATNGQRLMDEIAGAIVADEARWRGFVQELHIARDAGLLTFTQRRHGGGVAADPDADPHFYLQQVTNFALTVAGQDRARGQRVAAPVPDPAEDDGRPISGLILRQIADAIHGEYRADQIPLFLHDAQLPPPGLAEPDDVANDDIAGILTWLDHSGSEGRRALRKFIGRWLDDQLISGPTHELRHTIIEQLARQGWFFHNDRIVIGEPARGRTVHSPLLRDARLAALHPDIATVATRYYLDGHRSTAVFEAVKALNNRVKALTGLAQDGTGLMGAVFSSTNPHLLLADLQTETGRDIQNGYKFLFMGAIQAIRNPHAHEPFNDLSEDEALEQLGLASLLMRQLDSATRL